jgi:hypothetical protein
LDGMRSLVYMLYFAMKIASDLAPANMYWFLLYIFVYITPCTWAIQMHAMYVLWPSYM